MRVLLSTYDSRGGEPLAALAVRLRELGAEVLVCAPPDCAERLAEAGVPLLPVGPRPELQRAVRRGAQHPPDVGRPAAGGQHPRLRVHRPPVAGVGEVNQQALFGRVAAVVHHGGAGITTTATRAGRASGGDTPVGGPAILGRPGGRPGHRYGPRRPGSDHRVPVGRAQDGPGPRDPRTGDRGGRDDPRRRGDGARDAAGRRAQPGKAASVRVNHTGSPGQDPREPAPWLPATSDRS